MRLRHLRIRINTDLGLHGTDITFPDGLVVLWADNTMGKSTCLNSALVALGFEAMLTTAQSDVPLPHVMKAELDSEKGKATVIESDIYLEIENSQGTRIVVHRAVKGARSKDLVTVTHGAALTEPEGGYRSEDFFVARQGAASRERGFHRFLADFLRWQLPLVETYDGRQYPLYLQCIFPYMVVEQKRGWSSIEPPIPIQFRIKEPHKRVIEFILKLDAHDIAVKRMDLERELAQVESKWTAAIREAQTIAQSIGGVAQRLPIAPVTQWPPEIKPQIVLPHGESWVSAEELIAIKSAKLRKIAEQEIPKSGDVVVSAEAELVAAQKKLNEKEVLIARLLETIEMEAGELNGVKERLAKIEEDLQRNKDVKVLLSLGSSNAPNLVKNICPTCHQHFVDSLSPLAEGQSVMSIDENIAFIEEQRATFRAVMANMESIMDARDHQVGMHREEVKNLRAGIRAIKQTLVSDARLPSTAVLEARIDLQRQVERIKDEYEKFRVTVDDMEQLAHAWAKGQAEKARLPQEDTTINDRNKIDKWSSLFVEQLAQYDFKSLQASAVSIDHDSYRPVHEGFDLPTNISASDFIRVIWSYLEGLLELSTVYETNHPGLLVFDEPRQQSAKDVSFSELLKRSSMAGNTKRQVVFATSENREKLKLMLKNIPHAYIEFEGRMIKPISA